MADVRFTKNQQDAIDVSGNGILVSAAAGSGKTAVLTERAIRLLTGEKPVSADKLIIVTFTTAAAEEMRRRIAQKLNDRLLADPQNEWLRSQQLMLPRARISTIHSLCANLIRTHFELLGLPGEMRIADSVELDVLIKETVEEVFSRRYDAEDQSFFDLHTYYCGSAGDKRLAELVIRLYEYIRSFAFPMHWLEKAEEALLDTAPIIESEWVKSLLSRWEEAFSFIKALTEQAITEMSGSDLYEKYGPAFSDDLVFFTALSGAAQKGDADKIGELLQSHAKQRLGVMRKPSDPDLQNRVKDSRSKAYDILENETKAFFDADISAFPAARHEADRAYMAPFVKTLFSLVRETDELLYEKKIARGVIDFSDLEHMTVKLLATEQNGIAVPTALAQELAAECEEIMVDECQDISEVQETIFCMLSKREKNLFMVGDVKQSIYRFRQAMPELFIARKDRYAPYNGTVCETGNAIILEQNFRSRKEVCDVTNAVFTQLMTRSVGDIDYTGGELLVPGLPYPKGEDMEPEFCVVDCSEESEMGASEREARFLAAKIRQMVDSRFQVTDKDGPRACRFSDFAVLLRSTKGKSEVYADAMRKAGVPCLAAVADTFLDAYEVAVMRNLLRVTDNPMLDVALVSVMMSPIGAFDADDVARIRLLGGKEKALYLSLCEDTDAKSVAFCELLNTLRTAASSQGISDILRLAYAKTAFSSLVYALGEGEKKEANLKRLLRAAEQYESYASEGLAGFLRHLDRAQESGASFDGGNNPLVANTDSVRVLSIHASKGLEFPICIIADCAKPFNMMDLNTDVQMGAKLGFALKNIERDLLKNYAGLPFAAIRMQSKRELLAEEMRILYVAMTRAREKLIFVMNTTDFDRKLERIALTAVGEKPHPYEVLSANSYADWLLSAFLRLPSCIRLRGRLAAGEVRTAQYDTEVRVTICGADEEPEEAAVRSFEEKADPVLEVVLRERFAYEYPDTTRTKLPVKVSVTEIAKSKHALEETQTLAVLPRFLTPQGLTPAQRGTVLHTFMQVADHAAASADLESEITRLVERQYLTQNEADALNRRKIAAFYKSDLYRRMCSAKRVLREHPFIYEIPAKELHTKAGDILPDEPILLQGIADCLLFEEDGITIVDYKTDYVNDASILKDRYYDQLRIYRGVMEKSFGLPVKQCLLYSLHLEKEIEV